MPASGMLRFREAHISLLKLRIMKRILFILAALAGGMIWQKFGVGILFGFAAVMALANSAFALTIPRPGSYRKEA